MKKATLRILLICALGVIGLIALVLTESDAARAALAPTRTPRPTRTPTTMLSSAATAPTDTPTSENAIPDESTPDENAPAVDDQALTPAAAMTPGPMTSSVLLFDSGSVAANAVLHIYDPSGKEIYTGVPVLIPAKGAKTLAMPASVPSKFIGSAKVTSDNPVQAFVLDANTTNTARDMYKGTASASTSLDFPVFRHLGNIAQKSIIAVHNPDPSNPTTITLHYYKSDGTEGPGSPLSGNLQPLASAFFDSQLLFNTSVFTYTVHIDSTGSIGAAEQVLYTKDTASLGGLSSSDEGTQVNLDFVERKGNSLTGAITTWSEIYVENRGTNPTTVTMTYFTAAAAVKTKQTQTIQPKGYALFNTKKLGMLGYGFTGYVKVSQSGGEPLAAAWLEVQSNGTKFFGYNGVPSGQYALNWACGNVRRITTAPTQYTTFKIINVDSTTASIKFKLFAPSGSAAKATATFTLGAGRQLSVVTSNTLFGGVGTNYTGLGLIQSTGARLVVSAYSTFGGGGVTAYTCSNWP